LFSGPFERLTCSIFHFVRNAQTNQFALHRRRLARQDTAGSSMRSAVQLSDPQVTKETAPAGGGLRPSACKESDAECRAATERHGFENSPSRQPFQSFVLRSVARLDPPILTGAPISFGSTFAG
jgi:hypothetical protein